MDATVAESSGSPDHLLVLVHGLADTKSAWDRCVVELRNMPDAGRYVFLQSAVNARWRTHHGVDVCGQRLAEEICALLATAPGLTHVSMIGHSMGGMIARYAAGLLYRPADGTIAGLTPRHFVTLASPHLGLTVDAGPAQVPFVAWAGHLPVLGGALQRGLQAIGHGVAARLFSGTGRHFLALDGGPGELPLLIRMTLDEPDKGCYFFSALRAFRTRACYGNVGRDHWVSWQNATLRDTPQLPDLDPQLVRRGRGVVRDDPPEAAWSRASSSCGGGSSDRGAVRAAAACGAGIGGGGNGGGGGSKPEADATRGPSGTEAQAGNRRDQTQAPGVAAASKPADMEQERLDQGGEAHGAAAAARVDAGTDRVAPAGKDISLTAATAAAEAGPGAAAGGAAAATSAGEAQEVADADDVELEDSLTAAPESPSQVVSFALGRLQQMPWRRVDVSFAGARMGTAHNNIQATRWTNTVGAGVLRHLRQHLEAMELHVAAHSPGRAA
ncbi:hypothetical protein CHLRE_12g499950v5 [Chlamydomonas reinhardtii]|uniref:DUF676 domain-containing protein n=1 Tax=Chlamydomonas reinhardtii TaxID=3055 RepID=A0A2K3D3A7_CHLRE|nr:uncharacterized protein CHLRE_12g499950v5 [Chlamydomonas reinhardtii]PNW75018.1 hypothetical protein CHLRE_12g499950v5 [Chlamydomonas reinhardtii]